MLKNRMHVLNVNATLDPVFGGGTAERTLQMSKFLVESGVQCTILSTDLGWDPNKANQPAGVRVILLPCLWARFYFPRISMKVFREVVSQSDIIHLMGHWTVLNALVYLFATLFRKPYVMCPAGALLAYGRSKGLKSFYNSVIGRRIVKKAVRCIAITPRELGDFEGYGISGERVTVIPNGIDPSAYQGGDGTVFRQHVGLGDCPFILFLGRLNKIKGPDLLLRAFAELDNNFEKYHLVFAGPDDGMLGELKVLALSTQTTSRVHFVGYVGGETKLNAFRSAQIIAIPSRREAMSIVVLEAGIMGKAVLVTDQCGVDEVSRVQGGYVATPSVGSIASGLSYLLGDPKELKTMGENLRAYVTEKYGWKSVVKEYVNLYSKILNQIQ